LLNFGALIPNLFLEFFQARQVPEIIYNESSKNTENALIEWLRKETTRYFLKTKVCVVCLVLSLVSKLFFCFSKDKIVLCGYYFTKKISHYYFLSIHVEQREMYEKYQ
jgi:hypothetical protein